MAQQAAQIAALAIDPAKKAVNEQIKTAEDQRLAATRTYQGVIDAVARMSAGDAEAARAAFAGAGDRVAAYGQGFTGQLRADQDAKSQGAAGLIAALGAPGAVTSGGEANANVSYMLGGQMPAEELAQQGPNALAAVVAHRLATGIRLADDASAGDMKAQQEIAAIRQQLQALEEKRPGLIQDALSQLSQQANAKRATDTQIGYLQLQQAKSAQDAAIAWTNITGTVHVVGKNGKVVDTGRPATGSDAAQVAAQNQRAVLAAQTSRGNAQLSAKVRREIAASSNAARRYAADTAAQSRESVAKTNAQAKATAAKVKQQNAQGKPATAAQRSTIITAAGKRGADLVKSNAERIWQLTPGTQARGADEKDADYNKRLANATRIFNQRLREHRGQIVGRVAALIRQQLKLLGYTDAEIRAQADAIVATRIPAAGR